MGSASELLRRPEDARRATFLELFFDLAFVLALTRLSQEMVKHLDWAGAVQTLVLLLAVWSTWSVTAGMCDRFDPQRPQIELLIIGTMVGSLVMAAALPEAFGKRGLLFASAYVAVQIGRGLFLVIVLRGHELQRNSARLLCWYGVCAVPWIVGAFGHGTARWTLWTVAVVLEYTMSMLGFPVPGLGRNRTSEWMVTGEHLAERYRQFFTVALGELILIMGLTHGGGDFEASRNAAYAVTFATTVLLWRIYIFRAGELMDAAIAESPSPARLGRSVSYAHLVMVAGIMVTAVSGELVIAHPLGHTKPAWIAVILGGPALFLAGRVGFEYPVFDRVSRDRPIGLLLLVAVAPAMLLLPPLAVAGAATLVLSVVAVFDAVRMRARQRQNPSVPPGEPPN